MVSARVFGYISRLELGAGIVGVGKRFTADFLDFWELVLQSHWEMLIYRRRQLEQTGFISSH